MVRTNVLLFSWQNFPDYVKLFGRGYMLAKVLSYGLNGISGYPVYIELDVNAGLPSYDVVGLADTAIKESKARVKAAIKNSAFNYPINKIIVNLADRKSVV